MFYTFKLKLVRGDEKIYFVYYLIIQ